MKAAGILRAAVAVAGGFALLLNGASARAATTLEPGDIVVIGLSCDTAPSGGGVGKSFTFVPLVDLEAGTVINFTDCGWLGSAFRTGEGSASYTAPAGGVLAGTVISASGTSTATWGDNGPEWTSPVDGLTGFMNFSSSGDQILVFTGTSAAPTFIFAVNGASTIFSDPVDVDTSNRTALPTGLATGLTAVAVGSGPGDEDEFDNAWYTGTVTNGTRGDILAAVVNPANWLGDNSAYTPLTGGFSVSPDALFPEPTNYPTAFTATPAETAITLTWTDSVGGQLPTRYLVRAATTAAIASPVDSTVVVDDGNLADGAGALNVAFGAQTATFSELSPDQRYYFRIYPYSNTGTNVDYKVDGSAPAADAIPLRGPETLFEEDFEGFLTEWAVTPDPVQGGTAVITNDPGEADHALEFATPETWDGTNTFTHSISHTVQQASDLVVDLKYYFEDFRGGAVRVYLNGVQKWVVTYADLTDADDDMWLEASIDLTAASAAFTSYTVTIEGSSKAAFGSWSDRVWVDDVVIKGTGLPPKPGLTIIVR